ncbi:MAG: hypothetical protein LBB74_07875 [Chitinispirillales bacterium]|jgi:predicted transposase/invertase (TIGR01784 family)|nr:hypothetical protein [Chitinispirillales bacterium]
MVNKSRILRGYVSLVAKIRENKKDMNLDDAIKKAITECLGEGLLTDFLNKHKAEVIDMLVTEWNYDLEMEVREEKGIRKGRQEGRQEGLREGQLLGQKALVDNMRQMGRSIDEIAAFTGLSVDKICNILGL